MKCEHEFVSVGEQNICSLCGHGPFLEEKNPIFNERFECLNCKKEAVRIERISAASPINGSYVVDYTCDNCGETFSEGF